jgi:hypothetical protein
MKSIYSFDDQELITKKISLNLLKPEAKDSKKAYLWNSAGK